MLLLCSLDGDLLKGLHSARERESTKGALYLLLYILCRRCSLQTSTELDTKVRPAMLTPLLLYLVTTQLDVDYSSTVQLQQYRRVGLSRSPSVHCCTAVYVHCNGGTIVSINFLCFGVLLS